MQVFFPVIGCHFRLNTEATFRVLTDKNNAKLLNYLNLLPGCLPVSAWEKNTNIQSVELHLPKDSLLTLEGVKGTRLETEVFFYYYVDGTPGGKKYKFAILLRDINHKLDIYY